MSHSNKLAALSITFVLCAAQSGFSAAARPPDSTASNSNSTLPLSTASTSRASDFVTSNSVRRSSPTYDPAVCGRLLDKRPRPSRGGCSASTQKIMGGSDAQRGEMPWAVSVYDGSDYLCSGTLISTKHVITAAHCFFTPREQVSFNCDPVRNRLSEEAIAERFTIRYGSHLLSKQRIARIARADIGRFFESKCYHSDIALLELSDEIDTSVANYVCLQHREVAPHIGELKNCVVTGWGRNPRIGAETMNNLQILATSTVWDHLKCAAKGGWKITPVGIICSPELKLQNVCIGDSGGGLTTKNGEGRTVLIGTVSYGTPCRQMVLFVNNLRTQVYGRPAFYAADIDRFTDTLFPWVEA